jgi:hypothetical protein
LVNTQLLAKYESEFPGELDTGVEYWPTFEESRMETELFVVIQAFWDGTSCQLVTSYWHFVGAYCLHLQGLGALFLG